MSNTYVLISGAWHGGWAWRPVAEHLRAAGHRVLTPTLPGLGDGDDPTRHNLRDVIDSVVDLVESEDLHDITLVGHSWGGYVITGAAPRLAGRLRKVVYWAAFVPATDRSLYDEVPPHYQELFDNLARQSGNNSVAMPFEIWQTAFMPDASEDVQRMVHSLLVPQPMQYFTETVDAASAAEIGVPVAYVLGSEDVALPPGEYGWARFAERLGVEPLVVSITHEACFTQPDVVAESLLKA
jgi:pimeloyl-ACP methyl ester carboxylesterase